MDMLFLCGYFEPIFQEEIGRKTKTWVENAANTFQKRLIEGFRNQDISLTVVSAPLFGAWPTSYSDIYFHGFEAGNSKANIDYISFNNIWGYRNLSRASALKKKVRKFLNNSKSNEKAIVIYGAHTPYMEAACYAKKLDQNVHLCLVLPDLPQYMNLSQNRHLVYDFFKKLDIKKMKRINRQIDSYMLLTRYMHDAFEVKKRPYIVVEGISDGIFGIPHKRELVKTIVYAGKLQESFGVKRLIEAFMKLTHDNIKLVICGGGELVDYIKSAVKADSRIIYQGIVSTGKANEILQNADILVNPRTNDNDYTKYSFPSKNIEYLQTGNIVIGYMLDGIPSEYSHFMICPKGNSSDDLMETLEIALQVNDENQKARNDCIREYILNHCEKNSVAKQIIEMITREMENDKNTNCTTRY